MEKALDKIRMFASGTGDRHDRARKIAEMIRELGPYRWAGLYDVGPEMVSNIAWSGPAAPAYPDFPVTKGLTGSAVREKKAAIIGDVRTDPRYLTNLGTTLSEIIVPILDPNSERVIGTLDVESKKANAFSDDDRKKLEQCADASLGLWLGNSA
jgi:L-methionine (R)-S-oxide reductase